MNLQVHKSTLGFQFPLVRRSRLFVHQIEYMFGCQLLETPEERTVRATGWWVYKRHTMGDAQLATSVGTQDGFELEDMVEIFACLAIPQKMLKEGQRQP